MDQVMKKYGKEVNDYGTNKHDYIADDEITVTITLGEYRELVTKAAISDAEISKVKSALYDKDAQIKKLNERIEQILKEKYNGED